MPNQHSATRPIRGTGAGLAAAGVVLSVLLLTVAGAWVQARWPSAAGKWITVTTPSPMAAIDAVGLLRRVDGVQEVVTVVQMDALLEQVEPVSWQSVSLYAVQSSDAGVTMAPMPTLHLFRGRAPGWQALGEVALSYEVADVLHRRVGDTLTVRGRDLEVVGIWAPSARVPGNWVQVSLAAAQSFEPSGAASARRYLVRPVAGRDVNQIAARIWRSLPDAQVLSPAWERAQATQERVVLCLALGLAAILALLLTVPLLADLRIARPAASLSVALLSGMAGLAAAWVVIVFANGYARDALALTPFQLSLPLTAGSTSLVLTAAGLSMLYPGQWQWSLRACLAMLTIALCAAGLLAVGALAGSLNLMIADAQQTAADRVTVHGLADNALLQRVYRLPGVRGYAVEAFAGTVAQDEERWLGPWPASGLLYGVQRHGIEGTLSVPYDLNLGQGRDLVPSSVDEAVLGFDLAQARGLHVGDRLHVQDVELVIVGIRQHVRSDGLSDANWRVEVTLAALRRIMRDPSIMGEVTLLIPSSEDPEDKALFLQEVRTRLGADSLSTLTDRLGEVARAYPAAWCLTTSDAKSDIRHAQSLYAAIVGMCALVLLVMGALAVAGAFDHRLRSDERRIGLLKAFGIQDGSLVGSYLEQAIAVGVTAGLLGLCAGWACIRMINALAVRGGIELLLSPRLGASVVLLVLLACVVAAAIPITRSACRDAMPVLYDMSTVGGSQS